MIDFQTYFGFVTPWLWVIFDDSGWFEGIQVDLRGFRLIWGDSEHTNGPKSEEHFILQNWGMSNYCVGEGISAKSRKSR